MQADLQAQITFYLNGKRADKQLSPIDRLGLSPALFSGYRDLTRLRYDFPLVLVKNRADGNFAEPLSGLVDSVLEQVAVGSDAQRIRLHVMQLEQDIRALAAKGAQGKLSALWDKAARPLADADKLVADSLARARARLNIDGELVDCDQGLPWRLISHAWGVTQEQRSRKFDKIVRHLILKLSDILRADFMNSAAGKSANSLQSAFGTGPMDQFDFAAMSRMLTKATPRTQLPKSRRQRVEGLLVVLQSQQFFPSAATGSTSKTYSYTFDSCAGALKAYRERLPKAVALAKAIAIGELEIKGEYNESRHDALFASFGENALGASALALFPDYLVRLHANALPAGEQELLSDIVATALPIKILLQTDDLIETSPLGSGYLAVASRSRRLVSMALGMNEVFVLQAPGSHLLQLRGALQRGLDCPGVALLSIFSGAAGLANTVPPYLTAAAALESRAFPLFVYDPSAGPDWASRFSLAGNPQPELDWPLQDFSYQDARSQTVSVKHPFTLIDFVASDPRYSHHFAQVAQDKWSDALVPVGDIAALQRRGPVEQVPSLLMVDRANTLQKVIVDQTLINEAGRCRTMWHSLQELAGIHNSHAEKLLAREQLAWQQQAAAAVASAPAAAPVAVPAAAPASAEPAAAEPEQLRSPDEAYIETPRCSTCNECTLINNKMFAYDGNQQAYIVDVNAGSYAQLVEAAESCQVSIIHPGKPRNPNEPGLEELLKRAELFA